MKILGDILVWITIIGFLFFVEAIIYVSNFLKIRRINKTLKEIFGLSIN